MENKKPSLAQIKKEFGEKDWRIIVSRIKELKSGEAKGISLDEHLKWLKNRKS